MTTPAPTAVDVDPQEVALLNLDMLMRIEGKYRKDLAAYLGRIPQVLSRMMKSGSSWSFNDMSKAAQFVGVSLDTLADPTLTPAKARELLENGGLTVADDGDFRCTGGACALTLAA